MLAAIVHSPLLPSLQDVVLVIPSEVYGIPSDSIPSTLMHVVIIPLLKFKSKDPADVNNYRLIAIAIALCNLL